MVCGHRTPGTAKAGLNPRTLFRAAWSAAGRRRHRPCQGSSAMRWLISRLAHFRHFVRPRYGERAARRARRAALGSPGSTGRRAKGAARVMHRSRCQRDQTRCSKGATNPRIRTCLEMGANPKPRRHHPFPHLGWIRLLGVGPHFETGALSARTSTLDNPAPQQPVAGKFGESRRGKAPNSSEPSYPGDPNTNPCWRAGRLSEPA